MQWTGFPAGGWRLPARWLWTCAAALAALAGMVLWSAVQLPGAPRRTPAAVALTIAGSPRPPASASAPDDAAPPSLPPAAAETAPAPAVPSEQFTPVNVEAEDPGNTLVGGAAVVACPTCNGGGRVRYITGGSRLIVRAVASSGGYRTAVVSLETDGPRTLRISVNNGAPITLSATGKGWTEPVYVGFTAYIPQGPFTLMFFNDHGPAPDVDMVAVA
ncbi:hypothetical protein [Dactylosporangium sp. CA-092794]|uniref:hypothetical protein n=1 Tax=Dactylosporangium sp. CA-092794 TaxID=3239929 RepID=UPI003D8D93E2